MTKNQLEYQRNVETHNQNQIQNRLNQWQFEEQQRANQEAARHNRVTESISKQQAQTAATQAANYYNLTKSQLGYQYANLAEQTRSNKANEAIKQQQNLLTSAANAETVRSHKASEGLTSRGQNINALSNATHELNSLLSTLVRPLTKIL